MRIDNIENLNLQITNFKHISSRTRKLSQTINKGLIENSLLGLATIGVAMVVKEKMPVITISPSSVIGEYEMSEVVNGKERSYAKIKKDAIYSILFTILHFSCF